MNKREVKTILMSMRTPENEATVNYLLGEIDMTEESVIEEETKSIGNTEQAVRELLEKRMKKNHPNQNDEKYPINPMFTYGISGDCVHLHLPVDLRDKVEEIGIYKTMELVNLYLLDAIDKVKQMKDDGFYRLEGKESIYMISPAMIRRELKFLETLDFTTEFYSKKDLGREEFVKENKEAQLAVQIFGKENNVGTASILFEVINSKEWQEKKKRVVEDFKSRGISIEETKEPKQVDEQ